MSSTKKRPTLDALNKRYQVACDLKQPVNREKIAERMLAWIGGISAQKMKIRFVEKYDELVKIGRDARAAWDARAARDARDARAARAAWAAWDASWECSWLAITSIGALARTDGVYEKWVPLFEAFEAGCFAFWITEDEICVATLPTAVRVDSQRRLHCEDGPAFAWLSDCREYYWHGVLVPEQVIFHPRSITVKQIEAEENAEVRRTLIEIYGQARYLQDAGAKELHRDKTGVLFSKELRGVVLMMVQVVDATTMADGSAREYFMPVDGQLRPLPDGDWSPAKRQEWLREQTPQELTAHNAVASTFGLRGEDYAPSLES